MVLRGPLALVIHLGDLNCDDFKRIKLGCQNIPVERFTVVSLDSLSVVINIAEGFLRRICPESFHSWIVEVFLLGDFPEPEDCLCRAFCDALSFVIHGCKSELCVWIASLCGASVKTHRLQMVLGDSGTGIIHFPNAILGARFPLFGCHPVPD